MDSIILSEFSFHADRNEAVPALDCRGLAELQDVLETLPLVKEGLISFEVIPLAPYPRFSRLFDTE